MCLFPEERRNSRLTFVGDAGRNVQSEALALVRGAGGRSSFSRVTHPMNATTQTGQGRAQPLDGVRVVEIGGWVSAAFAGKILADLGAEVVVVEPSGGGALRRYGPFPGGEPDPEKSGLHLYLSTNKMSATLDLERDETRPLLRRLTAGADVDRPRRAPRRGGASGDHVRGSPRRQQRPHHAGNVAVRTNGAVRRLQGLRDQRRGARRGDDAARAAGAAAAQPATLHRPLSSRPHRRDGRHDRADQPRPARRRPAHRPRRERLMGYVPHRERRSAMALRRPARPCATGAESRAAPTRTRSWPARTARSVSKP